MKKNRSIVTLTAALLLAVIPLINSGMHIAYYSVAGDVLLASWAGVMSWTMYIMTSLSLYSALGFVVYALLRDISAVPFLALYGVGLIIVNGSDIFADWLNMTSEAFASSLMLSGVTALLNIGIEAVLFTITILFIRMFKKTHDTGDGRTPLNPFIKNEINFTAKIPVLVWLCNSLAWAVASTVCDIISVGLPVNMTEVVYLLSPYLLIAAAAFCGYHVIWAIQRFKV